MIIEFPHLRGLFVKIYRKNETNVLQFFPFIEINPGNISVKHFFVNTTTRLRIEWRLLSLVLGGQRKNSNTFKLLIILLTV